jgi:GNAT superfamily N-acetyltransferase
MGFQIQQVELGERALEDFVEVPWRLFRGDPCWTPPLRAELLGSRLLGITGLLTPSHPYHRDAEVTHFIARDGDRLLGRVSATVNRRFNEFYHAKVGFFGFFDVGPHPDVAKGLLDAASAWVKARGMETLRGPGGYSNATHEANQGVLVEGFAHPPTVELTHNPPYYKDYLEGCGFAKAMDYHAYLIQVSDGPSERLRPLAEAVLRRRDIETRPIDMRKVSQEVDLIVKIYNEAWAANWGFLPLTEAEGAAMASSLKLVADPGLMRFAYVDGELAAVLGALPDPNVALRPRWNRLQDTDLVRAARLLRTRRRIPNTRLMFFGVLPRFRKLGIDAVLYLEVLDYALRRGYTTCEPSLLLEGNDLILRASSFMGGVRYKVWRIYDKSLLQPV